MNPAPKSNGSPILLRPGQPSRALKRVLLGGGVHNEAWLQQLIFANPEVLPITAIEPVFADAISVACEVPCGHGYIDNVLVTPAGNIVLVEVKLWKNPQARREMVAQVLDYVTALMGMSYTAFEDALLRAKPTNLSMSLYDLVRHHPDALTEAQFIDTVSANLTRGRILAIAAGDGIHSEAQGLAALLQSHAGAHFTFALVELAIWNDVDADRWLCVPNTLAQTVLVERGIVRIQNGTATIAPLPVTAPVGHSLTQEMFLDDLAKLDPALPGAITAFLAKLAPLGVYGEQKASLILRADIGGPKLLNLGSITKSGQIWTDYLAATVPLPLALAYNQTLADLIGGTVGLTPTPKLLTQGGSAPPIAALLPQHADAWIDIITELLAATRTAQDIAA